MIQLNAEPMSVEQLSLLEPVFGLPEGFAYREDFVSAQEEGELASHIAGLELREFEFHGYLGKRRVTSFGLRYDFNDMAVHEAAEMPDFLLLLRDRAAAFAGLAPAELAHALVTEYASGAAIGWHRDRPVFGDVIGISLGRHAASASGASAATAGSAPRSCWPRARRICCAARHGTNGSTASRQSKICAIP